MDFEESLGHVKRLLGLLPGVEVVRVYDWSPEAKFTLVVRSQSSLARLAFVSLAANVLLAVSVEAPAGEYANPEHIRYILVVGPEPEADPEEHLEPALPPTNLQIVGIYLARELKTMGLLESQEADRLQVAWNAVPE